MRIPETKPCPICGGQADYTKSTFPILDLCTIREMHRLQCNRCKFRVKSANSLSQAIEHWNNAIEEQQSSNKMVLRECPFCGKDAAYILKCECTKNGYTSYTIAHESSRCILSGWHRLNSVYESEEEAIQAWNQRN